MSVTIDRTQGYSGHFFDPYVAAQLRRSLQSGFVVSSPDRAQSIAAALDAVFRVKRDKLQFEMAEMTRSVVNLMASEDFVLPSPGLIYGIDWLMSPSGELTLFVQSK